MNLYRNGVLANSATSRFEALDPTQNSGLGIGGLQSANPNLRPEYFNDD